MDVTTIRIDCPRDSGWHYWSAKDKFYALKFELVVSLKDPRIIWVAGAFKGSVHDLTIARLHLVQRMGPHEVLLADKGYIGELPKLLCPSRNLANVTSAQRQENREINMLRQSVERGFKRVKDFHCMKTTWRHSHDLCSQSFHIICKILNKVFESQPL